MKNLSTLLFAVFIIACGTSLDESLLHGSWKTTNWVKVESQEKINNKMDFVFQPDGRYKVDYGSVKEEGKYWIAGEYLHTVEDGQTEKSVKIKSLTAQKLEFEMNRAGTIEVVTLEK